MAERTGDTIERGRLLPGVARFGQAVRCLTARLRAGSAGAAARRFRVAVVCCTVLLLALLWGGAALHLAQDKAQTTNLAAMNVGNLSQVVDEHVTRLVYEVDSALLAARRDYETGLQDSAGNAAARPWHQAMPGTAPVPVEIVDAAGYVVAAGSSGPQRYFGADDAFTAQRAATADRLVIGKPVSAVADRGGAGSAWRIRLSRRLTASDGSFAGIVVATVDPAFLSTEFDKINIGSDGFIAVVGRDDFVIRACSTAAGVSVPRTDLRNSPLPASLAQASAGAFAYASRTGGTLRIVGYRALAAYPLVIAIGVSKAEVLGRYDSRRAWLLIACAAISAVVIAVAALLVDQNTRQLRAQATLQQQSETLQASRREAERANTAAQAADRAKSEFLADMSHELRTPLNAILGFSEVMSAAMFGPLSERYRQYADNVHSAGRHLLEILNDILDLSKVEAGRLELHEEMLAVAELFNDCRQLMADRAREAGLTLTFAPTDLILRGDELRLKQIMLNLLSNAVKFTPAGGTIAVTAALTAAGGMTIAVRDNGIGVKEEDIPRILEPFGQVDNALTRSQQGTGLGLPLVQRLVELHGGHMELASAFGNGTTVTLTFPAARASRLVEIAD